MIDNSKIIETDVLYINFLAFMIYDLVINLK